MQTNLFLDIESGPLPEPELLRVAPEFLPAANLKDPAKIAESIASKRNSFIEHAALDALTGKVLVISAAIDDEDAKFLAGEESALVRNFLDLADSVLSQGGRLVGFNIRHFDLPFLCRRAWIVGLNVPLTLKEAMAKRYSPEIVDLLDVWLCGDRDYTGQSLDNICKQCGIGEKTGDGKDFAKLLATDPEAAQAYALNDLELTRKLAKRLGVA